MKLLPAAALLLLFALGCGGHRPPCGCPPRHRGLPPPRPAAPAASYGQDGALPAAP